jgi:hypothetical protein
MFEDPAFWYVKTYIGNHQSFIRGTYLTWWDLLPWP